MLATPPARQQLLPGEPLDHPFGALRSERVRGEAAYLRVITFVPAVYGSLRIKLAGGNPEAPDRLVMAPGATVYDAVPAVPLSITVSSPAAPDKPLAEASATFAVNAYGTLWLDVKDGRLAVRITDDSYDRAKAKGRLTVYNGFPDTAVRFDSVKPAAAGVPGEKDIVPDVQCAGLPTGQSAVFNDLEMPTLTLWIRANLPKSRFQSISGIDFKVAKRWTLLFLPGGYGDFSVTAVPDGPLLNAEKITELPMDDGKSSDDAGR